MDKSSRVVRVGGRRRISGAVAALAVIGATVLAGVALAKTFTLQEAKGAKVTSVNGNTKKENLVVTSRGFAVYDLTGDSARHPECTKANSCFLFWPPATVSSSRHLTAGSGVHGRLGVWRRNGFLQLTLNGHPLYRFATDKHKNTATGEGIQTFGGTWHVIAAGSTSHKTTTATHTTTTKTSTATKTTTTSSCLYPPCY